ncbi:alpha/beta fold hydrolase [Streptomyces caatingaensis]|uniref:Hydrolase n=1 Tax=Streptomyces caatingaensis TaxID=1678637 RepID=A0A0K9XEZ9_9ACTN|nr:alpha/beta fold hydrolase [Streptomyces caatingaensis]KNB51808.1 hydrolase [Streptomyces caatingaensis]
MSRPPFLTLPPCARAHRLATSRGEFAVLDALPEGGGGRATALLLPGFTGSKEDFIALLEPLARAGVRAVAVDGRGQYESPGPDDERAYALAELAEDVHAQAAALGEGPVHLVGHSFGGLVARAAVLADARPFRSLTLMSSGPAAVAPGQRDRTRMLIHALAELRLDMESVWREKVLLDGPLSDDAFQRRRWLATAPAQLVGAGRHLIDTADRTAELAATALPKHVLSGEEDFAWPVPVMDAMAAALGARRTVIGGAGHSPAAERPAPTAAALLAFWEAVSPAAPTSP